jgi:CYTH domain-containing protein
MVNYEIERKFLLKKLPNIEYDEVVYMKQYYLKTGEGYSDRIRRLESKEGIFYQRTKKKRTGSRINQEKEKEISVEKFNKLKKKAISKIEKFRHIKYDGEYKWEIDIFKNLDLVIGEIEIVVEGEDNLTEITNKINSFPLPEFIIENLIMEVSDFKPFSNKRLAIAI